MMQNTLNGSQLKKIVLKYDFFTYNLVRSNLKQKVADLVKRIMFVLRTCRELRADLWNKYRKREWARQYLFSSVFLFKSQTTNPFKETRVLNYTKTSEASDGGM